MSRPVITTRVNSPTTFRPCPRVAIRRRSDGDDYADDEWMTPQQARAFARAVIRLADRVEVDAKRVYKRGAWRGWAKFQRAVEKRSGS